MRNGLYMNERGFTLIEVMLTVGIAVLAILGTIATNVMIRQSVESAQEQTLAYQDASRVIEQMRNGANTVSSDFQESVADAADDAETNEKSLPAASNEVIDVTFVDDDADPLDVTVNVTWNNRGLLGLDAQRSISVRTLITRRGS